MTCSVGAFAARLAAVAVLGVSVSGGLAACTPVDTPTPDSLATVRAHVAGTLAQFQSISNEMSQASDDRVVTLLGALGLLLQDEQAWLDANAPKPLDASIQVYEDRIATARPALARAEINPSTETITEAGNAVLEVRAAGSLIAP